MSRHRVHGDEELVAELVVNGVDVELAQIGPAGEVMAEKVIVVMWVVLV